MQQRYSFTSTILRDLTIHPFYDGNGRTARALADGWLVL
jgi:fido (protein-threonine AMPylation protein)